MTIDVNNYFGGCPDCGQTDGCTNVGRSHWYFCKTHRTKWLIGANLFSSWRNESEDEQRRAYDEIGLGGFTSVKPLPKVSEGYRLGGCIETYRDLAHDRFINALYQAIGGSPWADEVEAALAAFRIKFDLALDSVPTLARILDLPIRHGPPLSTDPEIAGNAGWPPADDGKPLPF